MTSNSTSPGPGCLIDYLARPYVVGNGADGAIADQSGFLTATVPADAQPVCEHLIDRLRTNIGVNRTVWGAKWTRGGRLSWELYFYRLPAEPVRSALEGLVELGYVPRCGMFSVEVDLTRELMVPAEIDLYSGPIGGTREAWCDRFDGRARQRKNTYMFDMSPGRHDALDFLVTNPHAPATLESIGFDRFDTGLRSAARKPAYDAIYYQGLTDAGLDDFLGWAAFPAPMHKEVAERLAEGWGRRRWDVGVDYQTEPHSGRTTTCRAAFYGCI